MFNMNQTGSCSLLRFPQEILNLIYGYVLSSTRLSFGWRMISSTHKQRVCSATYCLALLQVCRSIRTQIGPTWLGQVFFSFEDIKTMLDKLSALSMDDRSFIRHVRVSGDPLQVKWSDSEPPRYYRISQALKLLPGLQLETLTVLAGRSPEVAYMTLDMLVRHGTGWKRLYFISHNAKMFAFQERERPFFGDYDREPYKRHFQPCHWQQMISCRAGYAPGASVVIFLGKRITGAECTGANYNILRDPDKILFKQNDDPGNSLSARNQADGYLSVLASGRRETLVVVERGQNSKYQETWGSPYLEDCEDPRALLTANDWLEIHKHIASRMPNLAKQEPGGAHITEPMRETFAHVDDYVWPKPHQQHTAGQSFYFRNWIIG